MRYKMSEFLVIFLHCSVNKNYTMAGDNKKMKWLNFGSGDEGTMA